MGALGRGYSSLPPVYLDSNVMLFNYNFKILKYCKEFKLEYKINYIVKIIIKISFFYILIGVSFV